MATSDSPEVFEIVSPRRQTAPLVFASPHSGSRYPDDFVAQSPLSPLALRASEDAFVDELFAAAPEHGMPLLRALYPRAFIDPNREAYELDPDMFDGPLPDYANVRSSRVAAGLGTIAKVVSSGQEIYAGKLSVEDAMARIAAYYRPYHQALQGLVEETRRRFGYCILVDCHSMPSVGGPLDPDAGRGRADFILGDGFSSACDESVARAVEGALRARGYAVRRNKPFSGGFTTRHYGRPRDGIHAIQIEINRALYMDEAKIERATAFNHLAEQMTAVIAELTRFGSQDLAAE